VISLSFIQAKNKIMNKSLPIMIRSKTCSVAEISYVKTELEKKGYSMIDQEEADQLSREYGREIVVNASESQRNDPEYFKNKIANRPAFSQILRFTIKNDSLGKISSFSFYAMESNIKNEDLRKRIARNMHDSLIAKNDRQLLLNCMIDSLTVAR
jgi:signal transduction histidine kinase